MPSPSTSSTDSSGGDTGSGALGPSTPFGRPSAAAAVEPALRAQGTAAAASWRADGASCDGWTLRAASVTGVRHRLAGLECEDAYAWATGADALAVAVADGVGSVPGSGPAAAHACRSAVTAAVEHRGAGGEEAVVRAVAAAARAAAGGATTLVVALLTGPDRVICGRVGDSTALVLGPGGAATELFDPPHPERPDAATTALPGDAAAAVITEMVLGPDDLLVLLTDGVADPWRDGPATVAPALAEGLRSRPDPPGLLSLVDFSRHGCHDDRTVVCVWPRRSGP